MGCSSLAGLLLGVGGVGGEWVEGGAAGRAAECNEVVMGFLGVII